MESRDWPDVANRSIVGTFYSQLLNLSGYDLNHLSMEQFPKWARRVVDTERKRRKEEGSTLPTKAEKSRILTIGECDTTGKDVQQRQGPKQQTPIKQQAARLEIDGRFLHNYVANEATYHLKYDTSLFPNRERSISALGYFICNTPGCHRRKWTSGIVATVLEFSTQNDSY